MGITGLLPFVKNSCRPANIKDFSGATVAIDAYSWLHKGAFACAEKLVKGEKTDGYVFYCIKLLNMLLEAGVKPIMVFDGRNLPSKAVTEKKRRENREKTRQRGKELLCEGKVKEARECFQRCVDVTPEMAREVIQACRKKSIDCIVAPYEADAQMAYLDKIGMTQLIITEDSDLILFGCSKIFFKMDSCGGGLLYEKENLSKSFGANASKFSFEKFRYMCILSGCDYLPSLPGIGLAKACKFFSLTTITDISVMLSKLPSYLKMPKLTVSNEYKESFIKANNTFLYQLVFCPKEKQFVPLNPYPEGVTAEEMEYAGEYLDKDLAYELAAGNINVKTLKEYESTDFYNSPTLNEKNSVVWGSMDSSKGSTTSTKKGTAFKFSTPKPKNEASQKRKCLELEQKRDSEIEDLFSMYGGQIKKSKSEEISDEEPIVFENSYTSSPKTPVMQSIPKLPLKRIVKSRFFSSESLPSSLENSSSDFSTPSSSVKNMCEDFLLNSEEKISIPNLNKDLKECFNFEPKDNSNHVEQLQCNNKENIVNIFAKKKLSETSPLPHVNKEKHISSTPKEDSTSVLDVFSSESSAAISTVSSMQKSAKILSRTDSATKIKPRNLFSKKESRKMITTTIQDFKWKKEGSAKSNINLSLGSDGNSCEESFEDTPECEVMSKSPLKEISPYFLNMSDPVPNDSEEIPETVITILSEDEDSELSTSNNKSAISSLNKAQNKNSFSAKDKLSKCRSIGLSKKRKSSGTLPRKETLLNFNFTRKAVSLESS